MAQNTNVRVQITGDSSSAERAFKSATRGAAAMEQQLEKQRRAMDTVGTAMGVASAAIVAGFTVAARAAIAWESAFAGVRKTVDGTPEQLGAIEAGLRQMARTLPATHQELAAVAEAAGQLGVQTPAILSFTRTMIDLGETTNLSAQDAATAMARFANIMGTDVQTEIDNVGAAIVALGNNSATTEAEIVAMALRIAGAGRTIGLSESDVLGFSAALSSVGIEAEAGGTAISRTFVTIEQAVRNGGEDLEAFAQVAGMTSEQFATAYRDDAGSAIVSFIEGLGGIQAAGGDVFKTLEDLELGEIRVRDALIRASSAGDLFRESLDLGSQSWEENTALVNEAIQRYSTTEAELQRARNSVNDFAISLGQQLLPAVGAVADSVGAFASMLSDLPEEAQKGLVVIGSLTAVIGGVGGAALIAAPRVVAFNAALAATGPAGARAAGVLRAVGAALRGPWGIALVGAIGLAGKFTGEKVKQVAAIEDVISTLDMETGAVTTNTKAYSAAELERRGLFAKTKEYAIDEGLLTEAVSGNAEALAEVTEALERRRQGLANQDLNGEAMAVEQVSREIQEMAGVTDAAVEKQTLLADAARGTTEAVDGTSDASKQAAGSLGDMGLSAEDAAALVDDLVGALDRITERAFSVEEASDSYRASLNALVSQVNDAVEAEDEHARSLADNSEAGLANREAMRSLVEESIKLTKAMVESGAAQEDVTSSNERMKAEIEETARQLGFNEEETRRYTSALDEVPTTVQTYVYTPGLGDALTNFGGLEEITARLDGKTVTITTRNIARTVTYGPQAAMADGGIITPAANGLLRNPMMAPAGSNILWAEPETGGESYIPHAPSKRARSLDLWADTGRILGADMGRRTEVSVRTDGTDGAARIAEAVVRRQIELESVRRAWGGDS